MNPSSTPIGAVIFDYATWVARFPKLAPYISEEQAEAYFDEAGLYLNNTAQSPVRDPKRRITLLNLLVAHIALLNLPPEQGGGSLVGMITEARQGSVAVSTTQGSIERGQAWFCQTQPGASFWAATTHLRQMRFLAARS